MKFISNLIPLEEALSKINDNIKLMDTETIDLKDSQGRVLAHAVSSYHNSPPFDKSAMDGYAVIAEDTFGASNNVIKELKIIDRIGAGDFSNKSLQNGDAIVIATGAPIPDGANAVLMKEYTYEDGDNLEIHSQVTPGENISPKAEDIAKGDEILGENVLIRPQEMGLIASAGYSEVEVYKRPRVKLLITSNELVDPSPNIDDAKIINSNQYTIAALIRSAGATVDIDHGIDDFDEIRDAIDKASREYDCVITTGGTAISKGDVVIDAVEDLGEVLFHGVAMRPGKPVGAGIVNGTQIFMLSGQPVAAMGQFDIIARHFLFKVQGLDYSHKIVKRTSSTKIHSSLGRTDYIRAVADDETVHHVLNRGSGIIRSMVEANCYIIIDENHEGIEIGDMVDLIFFNDMAWPSL
ncbi:molybdopterin biosynthesis protein MoeA1 [Methanobrevibacter ruminantium M1]|uniref:Molybdopterin biosynthesis protein MoeA1 n=1 Tax=Methanobrevibacter ruminantium (strain ATCC 35063 / DSM 1093 / JCM 13430 / OCM 146 / M1) TaxID=634498 RepID=D3DYR0_METRM|nr:gephyrin-like molybdotransferase Glp [Methanobrevibacter ruminantium]ADC45980.1 molybdopterin biosynthesis protein MoeA1 [Methanobrevibacter ruminantium M1]